MLIAYPKIRRIKGRVKEVIGYTCKICGKRNLIGGSALNHLVHAHGVPVNRADEAMKQAERALKSSPDLIELRQRELERFLQRGGSLAESFTATLDSVWSEES
jgi:hypothetical protein